MFVARYLAFSLGMTPVPWWSGCLHVFGYNLPGLQYNFQQSWLCGTTWICETIICSYAPTNDIQMVAILLELYLEYTNVHAPCGAVAMDHYIGVATLCALH